MIIGWRAWFTEVPLQGKLLRFSSVNTPWEKLPRDGCLGIVLYEDRNKPDGNPLRLILSGHDHYFRADGVNDYLYGASDSSTSDIKARYSNPNIIRGIWTDAVTTDQVVKEMREAVSHGE